MLDPQFKREFFNQIRRDYPDAKIVVCESHLISEQLIAAAGVPSNLSFDLTKLSASKAYEVRLDRNDKFYVTSIALGVSNGLQTGKDIINFYPNTDQLTTLADGVKIETLYKAKMTVKKDTSVVMEGFSTEALRYVGSSVLSSIATTGVGAPDTTRMAVNGFKEAAYPLCATLPLEGNSILEVKLDFTTMTALTSPVSVYLMLDGFLVKGVCK